MHSLPNSSLFRTVASVFLLLMATVASGQNTTTDSTKVAKKPKVKKPPLVIKPTAIGFGTDAYTLLLSGLDKEFAGFELNADLSLNNHFIVTADYGRSSSERADDARTFLYENSGSFFRLGAAYNVLGRQQAHNAVFFGASYAIAQFEHSLDRTMAEDYWNEATQVSNQSSGLGANWAEANMGLKVKALGNLYLAAIIRVKFLADVDRSPTLSVGELPGYGKATSKIRGGFGYQLIYRIPFSK